jgi:hypothetical protein
VAKYRILERHTEEGWVPFGVAYERGEGIVLFAPPWRAHRTLEVASLEGLDERHRPAGEYRWGAVESTPGPVRHPIELLLSEASRRDGGSDRAEACSQSLPPGAKPTAGAGQGHDVDGARPD